MSSPTTNAVETAAAYDARGEREARESENQALRWAFAVYMFPKLMGLEEEWWEATEKPPLPEKPTGPPPLFTDDYWTDTAGWRARHGV